MFIEANKDMMLVGEAQDNAEAVRIAAQVTPDVLLMDLHMPLLDGVTAIRQIKQANPTIQIIVLTLEYNPKRVQAALDAGASLYLPKTVSTAELAQEIRACAGRSSGQA